MKYILNLKIKCYKTIGQLDRPQLILIVAEHLHRCYSFNFITKGDNFQIVLYCDVNMDPAREKWLKEEEEWVGGGEEYVCVVEEE